MSLQVTSFLSSGVDVEKIINAIKYLLGSNIVNVRIDGKRVYISHPVGRRSAITIAVEKYSHGMLVGASGDVDSFRVLRFGPNR